MPASEKHKRLLNNTLLPLNFRVLLNGDPVNLASYTVKMRIEDENGNVVVNDSSTGITKHPTQEFTAASSGLATCVSHGVKHGDQIIVANSGGSLPTGLAASTRYFAVDVNPNTFGLAALPDGASVITAAGSGTNTFYIVGSCQYDFQAGDVDAAGTFRAWAIIESGSEQHHFPDDELGMAIEIKAVGN